MRIRRPIFLLLLTLAFAPLDAWATSILRVPVEEMARHVDLIVRGEVVDVTVRSEGEQARRIVTAVTIRVGKVLKGHASGPYLTIRLLGGQVGDRVLHVPGTPGFRTGEEVILFLEATTEGFKPAGLSLGKFTVVRDAATGLHRARRTVDRTVVLVRSGTGGVPQEDRMSHQEDDLDVDELIRIVETAVPRKGGVR